LLHLHLVLSDKLLGTAPGSLLADYDKSQTEENAKVASGFYSGSVR